MTPVETLEAAVRNAEHEVACKSCNEGDTALAEAGIAILNRALVLAKRGHKDTLKLELALAEAWL